MGERTKDIANGLMRPFTNCVGLWIICCRRDILYPGLLKKFLKWPSDEFSTIVMNAPIGSGVTS